MVPTFLVVALDGGRVATPLLVMDKLLVVVFCFCMGTRGFIGLTCDVVALETTCFLGEIAFAVALDLTGRAVTTGFVTVVGRDVVAGRVAVGLVATVAVLVVAVDRIDLVAEMVVVRFAEATVGRVLVATSPREEVVTDGAFVTGIFEGAALGFATSEVGLGFHLETDGSRNRASPSSSDAGAE